MEEKNKMIDNTPVIVTFPEHEFVNTVNEKSLHSSTIILTDTSSETVRLLSSIGFILSNILIVIPISQLYFGSVYTNDCPIDYHIPHYLVIAGIVGILVVITNIIQVILERRVISIDPEQVPQLASAAILCCVSCLIWILNLFLFFWFIAGCYWIFHVIGFVQYNDRSEKTYCHPVLYRFACWILLFAFIFEVLKCCLCCWKAPDGIVALQNAKPSVTTTEP